MVRKQGVDKLAVVAVTYETEMICFDHRMWRRSQGDESWLKGEVRRPVLQRLGNGDGFTHRSSRD
jgi:hypothetical protein